MKFSTFTLTHSCSTCCLHVWLEVLKSLSRLCVNIYPKPVKVWKHSSSGTAVVQSSASTLRFSPLWAFVALTQGHISFEFLQLWAWFATMTKWMIIWCCVLIINQRRIEAKNCDNYFHYDLGAVRTVASGTQLEQEIRRGKLLAFSSIERWLLYHDWWCVHFTVQYSTRCSYIKVRFYFATQSSGLKNGWNWAI